ncbi:VWA domain-containing protein, partial [bacterium]|nr:VWA domain-containing protein [bacterium]
MHEPQDTKGALKNIKEKSNVIFIIDYSNSMNEKIDDKTKLELAVNTVSELMEKVPKDVNVGLRVYGFEHGFTYLFGCKSSKLFVPLGKGNREMISSTLNKLTATGWTPITYSLKQAVEKDFIGVEGKKHIVLLTDGGENCDESPCTFAINLMQKRDDISIDVIAFDLNDYEARNQLRCTAL